jgi:hypothetical protein
LLNNVAEKLASEHKPLKTTKVGVDYSQMFGWKFGQQTNQVVALSGDSPSPSGTIFFLYKLGMEGSLLRVKM